MLTERSSPRLRGRGRRRVPEGEDAAPEEEEEKEAVPQPPPSDDTRVENMDISDEGEGALLAEGGRAGKGRAQGDDPNRHLLFCPPEEGGPPPGSPELLEEDEAELELQKQLEKGRRLRQLQQLHQLRDSGEKVRGRPQAACDQEGVASAGQSAGVL